MSRRKVDRVFQHRIEALQSVDRSVAATVRALREAGELHRTLLVFTSDHGYLLGQHRYVGKRLPYEESLRVPLLMRGPGVPARAHSDQLTTTADLTGTIVSLAQADPPYPLDGVSLLPALSGEPTGRSSTILQTGAAVDPEGDGELGQEPDDRGWLYRGYRDDRWTFARYPDPAGPETPAFEELYDRDADPYQLHNLATDPQYAGVLQRARERAAELEGCAGAGCHPDWETLSGPGAPPSPLPPSYSSPLLHTQLPAPGSSMLTCLAARWRRRDRCCARDRIAGRGADRMLRAASAKPGPESPT